ncbi:hypothetical protein CRUP_014205 [Coryphaenoides rupestris]|nr:hypothetical protein CRUP_014205 [Coryphaenoides rupestris]
MSFLGVKDKVERSLRPLGLSVPVRQDNLYTGLSGFNGALGCMWVGGLFFTFNWRSHLFAIATGSLMLLLTGRGLAAHRIPSGQVRSPERNLRARSQWEAGKTSGPDAAVV